MKKILTGMACFMFVAACSNNSLAISSPSGLIELDFSLDKKGSPSYKVFYKGKAVIEESALGFRLMGQPSLDRGFEIIGKSTSNVDKIWEQPWGEERYIQNKYNQLSISLREKEEPNRQLNITFRVFEDGIGFRYEFPEQEGLKSFEITEELTEFNMAENHSAWWTPALAGNQYEYLYRNTPLNKMKLAHTPITMETESGLFLTLHEAALHDYSTMNVVSKEDNRLQAKLVPWSKENVERKVIVQTPFKTPWRTLQLGEKAGDLITSYLTLNLNEENKLGDVSWIKPGKFIGIWWELHLKKTTWQIGEKHGATTANTKKYIDFAAQHGFDGVLVEGWNYGWESEWWNHGGGAFKFTEPYPDFDVAELSRYAKEKGVYIIGHHETGSETDNYEQQLEEAYEFLSRYGMKAVKTGYVESGELLTNGHYHHGQFFVRHADKVTKMAAKHKVMLVAHETVKDTGERRTYPNLISREVARGQEYDAWSDDGGNPPNHTTILPFTRLLAGPMDFTPGAFELSLPDKPNNQVNTTLAKQLALYVVIYSPVQMASDLPENYEKHLDAFEFIKEVPVDWETTRVLGGEIGEYIAIARRERDGDSWFVGAVTNEGARELELKLDFLQVGKNYKAKIYKDAKTAHYQQNPAAFEIEERRVTAKDKIMVQLASGGGAAISLLAE